VRILIAISALLLAGLVLAGALLTRGTTLPWLTTRLALEASEALGRKVTLTEAPYLRVGSILQLRLRGVQVANADWAGAEALAELDEAYAALKLRSLFTDGPLEFDRVSINGLRLRLTRNEEGHSNLPEALTKSESSDSPTAPDEEPPTDVSGPPLLIDDLNIRNVELVRDNREQGTQQELRLTELTQTVNDADELLVNARGSLQNHPWSLQGTHSGLRSLLTGEMLQGEAEAHLADLALTFDYRLADLNRLENLTLNARLTGTPPERIAALSPLLSAHKALLIDAVISDISPGISIEAVVDLGDTKLRVSGSSDDPGSGDGLNLTVDADVSSLSRLARALNLGPINDVSLTIDGRLRRRGQRFELDDLVAQAGEHRIEGRVLLPHLPGTTDARAMLRASGPDFGFYQRLFERPFAIDAPYSANLTLEQTPDKREALEADLQIGTSRLRASGVIGDFPSYHNTQLTLAASVEDLAAIGASLDFTLPATALSIEGDIEVTQAGRIVLPGLVANAAGIEATLSGGMDAYPELDDIDLSLEGRTGSLARSSRELQGPALAELPASLSMAIRGSVNDLVFDTLEAEVGGSRVRTVSGSLGISESGLRSDLHLAAEVDSLARLFATGDATASMDSGESTPAAAGTGKIQPGASADDASNTALLRDRPFSFELLSDVTPERVEFTVTRLQGLGVRGEVLWRSGPDFAPDESMLLNADLTIDTPSELLPAIKGYSPPRGSLSLRAETTASPRRVSATLIGDGSELLRAVLIPRAGSEPASLSVSGAGAELRRFGRLDAFPEGPLPYRVEASARIDEGDYAVEVDDLRVGDTRLTGSVSWQPATKSLTAGINVPQADLAAWLPAQKQAPAGAVGSDSTATRSSRKERLIPATPLPVTWLDDGDLHVHLTTGPLGLPDPQFPDLSIIEASDLRVVRRAGRAELTISELRGSRGNLVLAANAERTSDGARLSTDWQIDRLPIGILSDVIDPNDLPRHRIEARFTGQGSTLRGLANTLNGEMLLTGTGGELKNLNLRLMTDSFLQQLFSTLLPVLKTDTPSLKVQCSVVGLQAKQGVVALDPGFIIRTDRVDLSARGALDLATERLTIRFDNQARRGLGISAASLVNPYVQITGTLANPFIGLDIANSALAGGAAFATGGLTILAKPLFGRFLQRKSPCDIALERWENRTSKAAGTP
jgi:uncharacterized protein involved in outer membrane biogenesis